LEPGEFSAHGLRSGYLTEAANRGIPSRGDGAVAASLGAAGFQLLQQRHEEERSGRTIAVMKAELLPPRSLAGFFNSQTPGKYLLLALTVFARSGRHHSSVAAAKWRRRWHHQRMQIQELRELL
jgi:hypothetical protein